MVATPDISVVVPVFDEAGAAPALAQEIAAAFAGRSFEIIFVDDASRDDTRAVLSALRAEIPQLRVLSHQRNSGQSRAIRSGILGARGAVIVTLDGDGQNDPADGPALVDALMAGGPDLAMVGATLLRSRPPLPAGVDAARGLPCRIPASAPPPSPDRAIEIHQRWAAAGLGFGPARGHVAAVAVAQSGRCRGAIDGSCEGAEYQGHHSNVEEARGDDQHEPVRGRELQTRLSKSCATGFRDDGPLLRCPMV